MDTITTGSQLYARAIQATYELQEFLGGGRIAQVYRAEQLWPPDRKGHRVAVKLARSAGENKWLEAEKALLENVGNVPGFPRLEGYGETREDPPRFFLVLEFIQGKRLSTLAQEHPNFRLPEPLGIKTACQYARVLEALHRAGYASTDRKLDDIYWIEGEDRLVVLDWNVAAKTDDSKIQALDLYQFGLFWYELLLGSPPPRLQERARFGLESHPYWQNLTYGTQYILARALDPITERRYTKAEDLVKDLDFLMGLFHKSADELREKSLQETDPRQALIILDVIRLHFPEVWGPQLESKAEDSRKKLRDRLDNLLQTARGDLEKADYEQATNRLEQCLKDTSRPDQQLRVHRWMLLARFAQALSPEIRSIFQEHALRPLINVIESLEREESQKAVDEFWGLLKSAFLPVGTVIPSKFTSGLETAKNQYMQGGEIAPSLEEAYTHLKEPQPGEAELFASIVGLRLPPESAATARPEPLRFLADEAMFRLRLYEAANRRDQHDLKEAAQLYGQALSFFEALPSTYQDLLRRQFGEPREAKDVCENLDRTLGEAERFKKAGEECLAKGDFRAAEEAFGKGLALFSDPSKLPEWAKGWGEGVIWELRWGRRRAHLRSALKEALEPLQAQLESPPPAFLPSEPPAKSRARKDARPQLPTQELPHEEDSLEVALLRCRRLLEAFPDDEWGKQQEAWLKDRLVRQVEEFLHPQAPVQQPEASAPPEEQEARLTRMARLISLARRYFGGELQKELQEWEVRATLALQGELNRLLISAEKQLQDGWRVNLGKVLDEWERGHSLLRQLGYFQEVFDRQALRAQEAKLDALYEQVRNLAQLQRDVAAEIGTRRAQIDAEEQKRREERRRAYFLVQEARELWEKPERRRIDLENARSKVQEACNLWPECPGGDELLRGLREAIGKFNQQFKDAWNRAKEALTQNQFEQALQALEHMPLDLFLSPEQIDQRDQLRVEIQFQEAFQKAEESLKKGNYRDALEALSKAPEDEKLTPEQRKSRDSLRLQIIGEALSQARAVTANGQYEDARQILDEIGGAAMTPEHQQEHKMLEKRLEQFQKLASNLEQASQRLETALKPLEGRPLSFGKLKEHLKELISWIGETPEELPEGLREKANDHLCRIENALWEARKHLRFWQTGPLADVAESLSIVRWLQQQVKDKKVFALGEETNVPSTEIAG